MDCGGKNTMVWTTPPAGRAGEGQALAYTAAQNIKSHSLYAGGHGNTQQDSNASLL